MSGFEAVTDGIRGYGDTAAEVAGHIAGAGAFDLAANITALTPVFGAVGADFLAMFGIAQASHAKSVGELANHYGATALAAHVSAAGYDGVDQSIVSGLGQAGSGMEARA